MLGTFLLLFAYLIRMVAMICRTTFHWLHADWEIGADAKCEPTNNSDTSISLSIEAHKDRNLRLLKSNESRELVNWIDGNEDAAFNDNVDDDVDVDDDAGTDSNDDDNDDDEDDDTVDSKFDTVDTDAKQREIQGPDPWDNPIILILKINLPNK